MFVNWEKTWYKRNQVVLYKREVCTGLDMKHLDGGLQLKGSCALQIGKNKQRRKSKEGREWNEKVWTEDVASQRGGYGGPYWPTMCCTTEDQCCKMLTYTHYSRVVSVWGCHSSKSHLCFLSSHFTPLLPVVHCTTPTHIPSSLTPVHLSSPHHLCFCQLHYLYEILTEKYFINTTYWAISSKELN